jgi:hypothetical protein
MAHNVVTPVMAMRGTEYDHLAHDDGGHAVLAGGAGRPDLAALALRTGRAVATGRSIFPGQAHCAGRTDGPHRTVGGVLKYPQAQRKRCGGDKRRKHIESFHGFSIEKAARRGGLTFGCEGYEVSSDRISSGAHKTKRLLANRLTFVGSPS